MANNQTPVTDPSRLLPSAGTSEDNLAQAVSPELLDSIQRLMGSDNFKVTGKKVRKGLECTV